MKHISPYLFFEGNCRQVMEFYHECIGGELYMQTIGESPMAAQMPAEKHNDILHAAIMKDGVLLMASDRMDDKPIVQGTHVDICIVCSSKEELNTLFSKLSQGGNVTMPVKEEFFGTFAGFTDKFGVQWMLQFDDKS